MSGPTCPVCGTVHTDETPCPSGIDERVGTVLDGKFEIVRVLGVGGMGKVYEGRHAQIGRRVAIKFMLPQFASHPEIVRRFENEARAAGSLEHENIAVVYDVGRTVDGARFLVMEFLQGQDCDQLLAREGPLPVARAVNIVLHVCRGLDAAHKAEIVHRDLKPANLFLTKRADRTDLVKILDFGIAKLRSSPAGPATATGTAMGTAHYMSPEQARGDKSIDHRTDIYALGVILYELLSGKKPHDGDSPLRVVYNILNQAVEPLDKLRCGLPSGLAAVVMRALEREPAARFQTVADLGDALIPFAGAAVPPFRSCPAAVAAPPQAGATLPSPSEPPRLVRNPSTTAPVSPKTRVSISEPRAKKRARWALGLGLLVVAVVGTLFGIRYRMAPRGSPDNAAAIELAATASTPPLEAVTPSASTPPLEAVAASASTPTPPIVVTGQSGDRPNAAVRQVVASTTRDAAGLDAGAKKGEETTRPVESASPVPPPTPATAPPPTPTAAPAATLPGSPGAIDISRDPNF